MSFLFSGFRDNNGEERANTNYPSDHISSASVFTRLCDYLINNDDIGLHEEFEKNLHTMKCIDYTKMKDKNGNNLLHMAVIYGCNTNIFEVMIEKQKLNNMMFQTNNTGETPYRMAIRLNMRDPLIYFEKNINSEMSNALEQYRSILRQNNKLKTMYNVAHEKSKLLSKELEKERSKNIGTKRTRWSGNYDNDMDTTEVKRHCISLEHENQRQKNEIKMVNETNDYLESENRKLQIENKNNHVEYERLSNKVKMFETQNKEFALKNTKLMTENKSLSTTIKSLKEENNDLIIKNKKLKTQVDSFINASRRK